jgi:hypothetical protein
MFYVRINKVKVFNNREGFLGLFNRRAELRIYSVAVNPFGISGHIVHPVRYSPLRLDDSEHFEEEIRKERYTDRNEKARFSEDNRERTTYVHGKKAYKGRIEGRIQVYI